ncbi:little elongation complex subunit 2 isoform X2 [Megalops cyprinoides]|uniref:little elongation complex subunit 2 isoform X2 n=1 Tax=Megalops cyprinoides TaxID=118141 RepID=UPI001864B09B|nr:little elongation complex subunit 2 isoform X2 [Megalops cyprinoides]
MELTWDTVPCDGTIFFSRDLYDKHSLAPTVKELWAIAQSSASATAEVKTESAVDASDKNADCPPSAVPEKGNLSAAQNPECGSPASDAFPEPRVPFPGFSMLTSREQQTYVRLLMNKTQNESFQLLHDRVMFETTEFMKYLQDVARICADDYNYLSPGAARYAEECLRASLEKVKNYPPVYLLQEMTSITGGKFNPELSLNFEKQLLALGKVTTGDFYKALPKDVQLAVDYETVFAETPPEKKASLACRDISSDQNAENLCARYDPHVCLTNQAFVRLLNNHGPDYCDQWEIPVCVKETSGKDSRKVVYIDSPLVKTEMTVREKSLLFQEESMKLALKRTGSKKVFELLLDHPESEQLPPLPETCSRSLVAFDDTGVDFETDLADLETFGESSSALKKTQIQNEPHPPAGGVKPVLSQPAAAPKELTGSSETAVEGSSKVELAPAVTEADSAQTGLEASLSTDRSEQTDLSFQSETEGSSACSPMQGAGRSPLSSPPAKRLKPDPAAGLDKLSSGGESDEERLVIDVPCSPSNTSERKDKTEAQSVSEGAKEATTPADPITDTPRSPSPTVIPDTPMSPSPEPDKQPCPEPPSPDVKEKARKATRRSTPRVSHDCDQLGQILRMQTALLKPRPDSTHDTMSPPRGGANLSSPAPQAQSHPQSLVKPCVSSYLEASQSPVQGTSLSSAVSASADSQTPVQNKRLLSEDLLVSAEDEQDYESPEEGNLLYRLYSLQDILLMVRSSVPYARFKKIGTGPKFLSTSCPNWSTSCATALSVSPRVKPASCGPSGCSTPALSPMWGTLMHSPRSSTRWRRYRQRG